MLVSQVPVTSSFFLIPFDSVLENQLLTNQTIQMTRHNGIYAEQTDQPTDRLTGTEQTLVLNNGTRALEPDQNGLDREWL